jgi:hypothetical protein
MNYISIVKVYRRLVNGGLRQFSFLLKWYCLTIFRVELYPNAVRTRPCNYTGKLHRWI